MNKDIAKVMFRHHGLRAPQGVVLAEGDPIPELDMPLVVKPCCGGSSVATTYVSTPQELQAALEAVYALGETAVVEEYVKGREFSVGVFNDRALPVLELVYDGPLFDYYVKYQQGACQEICPAHIDDDLRDRLQELAVAGHRALGLEVYSRLDFLVKDNGDIYVLEANTLPGMTATSIVPQMAAQVGIDYPTLCEEIIHLSLRRFS